LSVPKGAELVQFEHMMTMRTSTVDPLPRERKGRWKSTEPPMYMYASALQAVAHAKPMTGSIGHSAAHKAWRLQDVDLMCSLLALMVKQRSSMRPIINQGVVLPLFADCACGMPFVEQVQQLLNSMSTKVDDKDLRAAASLVVLAFTMDKRTRYYSMLQRVSIERVKRVSVATITGPMRAVNDEFRKALDAKDALKACTMMQIARLKYDDDALSSWGCASGKHTMPEPLWETMSSVACSITKCTKKVHPKVSKCRTIAKKMAGHAWTHVMVNLICSLCSEDAELQLCAETLAISDALVHDMVAYIKALAASPLDGVRMPSTVQDKDCTIWETRGLDHFIRHASYIVGETTTPQQEEIVSEAERLYLDANTTVAENIVRMVNTVNDWAKKNDKFVADLNAPATKKRKDEEEPKTAARTKDVAPCKRVRFEEPPEGNAEPPTVLVEAAPARTSLGLAPTFKELVSHGKNVYVTNNGCAGPSTTLEALNDPKTGQRVAWLAVKGPLNAEPVVQIGFNALMHKLKEAGIIDAHVPTISVRKVEEDGTKWMLVSRLTANPDTEPVMMLHKETKQPIVNMIRFKLPLMSTALEAGVGCVWGKKRKLSMLQQLLVARVFGVDRVHLNNMVCDTKLGPVAISQMRQSDDPIGGERADVPSMLTVFMTDTTCSETMENMVKELAPELVKWMDGLIRFLDEDKENIGKWSVLDWDTVQRRAQSIILCLKMTK
jgi:hypothetical protein